jgi:hypothetical protein
VLSIREAGGISAGDGLITPHRDKRNRLGRGVVDHPVVGHELRSLATCGLREAEGASADISRLMSMEVTTEEGKAEQ